MAIATTTKKSANARAIARKFANARAIVLLRLQEFARSAPRSLQRRSEPDPAL
jgi:hypothetical protein